MHQWLRWTGGGGRYLFPGNRCGQNPPRVFSAFLVFLHPADDRGPCPDLLARQVDPANVKSCTLNGVGQTIGGASVVVLNGDDSAIYSQVAKDGSLPPHPDCFMGVNFEIPSG